MELAQEEVVGSNDHTGHVMIKGKRTKRQRSSSPLMGGGVMTPSSSSSGCGGSGGAERGVVVVDDNNYYNNNNSISSPTTSSGEISTEEEEDMANCLIMLAQGKERRRRQRQRQPIHHEQNSKIEKLQISTRKFEEITTTTKKAGFLVYECKTCNRSFPSFQALGGHRASHKKAPKPSSTAIPEEKPNKVVFTMPFMKEYHDFEEEDERKISLSLQASSNIINNNQKVKIHECSICGSEFASGQALGGHMRRHRTAAATGGNSNQAATSVDDHHSNDEIKPRNILQFDLNLPAPEDDLGLDSNLFQFGSTTTQQGGLVFSARALVDCHY